MNNVTCPKCGSPFDSDYQSCCGESPMTNETKPVELKPCPFCNGVAKLSNVRMSNHSFRPYCTNEFCILHGQNVYFGEDFAAASAWNHRPIESALQQQVADLTAKLERVRKAAEEYMFQVQRDLVPDNDSWEACQREMLIHAERNQKAKDQLTAAIEPQE